MKKLITLLSVALLVSCKVEVDTQEAAYVVGKIAEQKVNETLESINVPGVNVSFSKVDTTGLTTIIPLNCDIKLKVGDTIVLNGVKVETSDSLKHFLKVSAKDVYQKVCK